MTFFNTPFLRRIGIILLLYNIKICKSQDQNPILFNVNENATIGTIVGRVTNNTDIEFVLTNENDSPFREYFESATLENEGIIVTKKLLQHQLFPFYEATLYDYMNGVYIQVEIVVQDVNDHSPTFSDQIINLNISESVQLGAKFSLGSATDMDSRNFSVQGYKIVDVNHADKFEVRNRTIGGQVFADLIAVGNLDRENVSFYSFTVQAYDGGTPPKTGAVQVNINVLDVNDNAPTFELSRYSVPIPEDTSPGTDIITITATDRDSGRNQQIFYQIDRTQSDPEFYFEVDSDTGRIYLEKQLDFEETVQHRIVLEAVDNGVEPQYGSTVVIVSVDDVNDNKPTISVIFLDAGQAVVSEAAELGDYIARLSVSDPDLGEISNIAMSISGGNNKFALLVKNDVTYLVVNDTLDRETQFTYHITVTATDFTGPSDSTSISFTLTIDDVNDNPPMFTEHTEDIQLPEDSFPGTFVTQVSASDLDYQQNALIQYSISPGDQSNWFSINPNSGLITTRSYLDYSTTPVVHILVVATDSGIPPLSGNTTVTVSITSTFESSLKFEKQSYIVSVPENADSGRCIIQVQASNPELDDSTPLSVTYAFVGGPNPGIDRFSVNQTTGHVCVTSSLDRETRSSYDFQLQATDANGYWDRADLHVIIDDVNEYAPTFHPLNYVVNVNRNMDVGFPITQVSATDPDDLSSGFGRIGFNITGGNDGDLFSLDFETGEVAIAKTLENAISFHSLTISATDGGHLKSSHDATVNISILDEDVSTGGPIFTKQIYDFNVDENPSTEIEIGTVMATLSGSESITYSIRSDPPSSNWFTVGEASGIIIASTHVDREIFSNVTFQIIASSGTPPVYGFSTVNVNVNDLNDNAPYFTRAVNGILPVISIPTSIGVAESIGNVEVLDSDFGDAGTIEYSMSHNYYFGIDRLTGAFHLISQLPALTDDYSLTVTARDKGSPAQSSSASLTIHVELLDVVCPFTYTPSYHYDLREDASVLNIFGMVGDSDVQESFVYGLENSLQAQPFSIFPDGSLYLTRPLDREEKSLHSFQVIANQRPASPTSVTSSCAAIVDVTVNDVNDNAPQFAQHLFSFSTSENLPAGSYIGSVSAVDRDTGINSQILYSFAVPSLNFRIDAATGIITTLKILDHEENYVHKFMVQASDGQFITESIVHVVVNDVNDNAPIFLAGQNERLAILSLPTSDFWVADMQAADADSYLNGKITYTSNDPSLFSIDPDTGTVTYTPSSPSVDGLYNLIITAKDNGNPSKISTASLKVRVELNDQNSYQFNSTNFVFPLREGNRAGEVVGSFADTVSRKRRQIVPQPRYRFISGNEGSNFYLNTTNGDVTLVKTLNYEEQPQYNIKVATLTPTLQNDKILEAQINIRDANDHTPTFISSFYEFGIEENTPIGKEVWRFKAVDLDSGLNGEVEYSLVSQSPSNAFSLQPNTGVLSVAFDLDRENIDQYTLVVNATDLAPVGQRFSTVSAHVIIRDVNDNTPKFVSMDVIYAMEDEPVGYPLVQVETFDPDRGVNGHVTYALVPSDLNVKDESDYFHIDSSSGVITLTKQLDYERSAYHILNISASDLSAKNQLTSYQDLTLYVMDVNDITPRFERSTYNEEIGEGLTAGAIVTKVTALDEDSGENGKLTYSLQESNFASPFTIDPDSGIITTNRVLDREETSSYQLTVYAQDGSFPSLYDWCIVNVDVGDINDNPPMFNPLDGAVEPPVLVRIEIPEYVVGPEVIHTVVAFDRDEGENARITYAIIGGNSAGNFNINSTTGELSMTRQLDREITSSYQLEIEAKDNGLAGSLSSIGIVEVVAIDFNDNDPEFLQRSYHGSVDEGLIKGQYVLTVRATDADEGLNSELSYYIQPSAVQDSAILNGLFSIDSTTGVITTAGVLDAEVRQQYFFSVIAIDSAPYGPRSTTVPIVVNVTDVNDNTPVFDESLVRVNISRSVSTGVTIGHIRATDADSGANGQIRYSFTNESAIDGLFTIDPTQGYIRTNRPIPSTLPSPFTIEVTAADSGNPPQSTNAVMEVSILGGDINFAYIKFNRTSYEVPMSETVQRGYHVTTVHATLVGGEGLNEDIVYSIVSGNEKGAFSISRDGVIVASRPNLLDYETQPNIRLIVSATIGNGPFATMHSGHSTIYIQLFDENDNAPKFSQDKIVTQAWEELLSNFFVLQVAAHDADSGNNGEVRYHISSGNLDNAFEIGEVTGIIQTALKLDREIHDQYRLVLHATDLGDPIRRTGTCTVEIAVVDSNDHAPTLSVSRDPIRISEHIELGTVLTTVTANDLDSKPLITFDFKPGVGNPGHYFNIDKHSGSIYLMKALDFEEVEEINLIVRASDEQHVDEKDIVVYVTDENDNKPVFDQQAYDVKLNELAPVNTTVLTVHATDLDSGENGKVFYRLESILPNVKYSFAIDSESGVIYTNASEALNPQSTVYNLHVVAYDNGAIPLSQSVSVRIEITDINNNEPVFNPTKYEVLALENVAKETSIANVSATDADYARENSNIYYEIVAGNIEDAFKIRTIQGAGAQRIGEVLVANKLDRENVRTYTLTVTAFDRGVPQLSSNASLVIDILDVNDNQPRFNQAVYYGVVDEIIKVNNQPRMPKTVLNMYASDADSSTDFKFKIIAGNDDRAFELTDCVPSIIGCVQLIAKFVDYEAKTHYDLTVEASDSRNSHIARSSTVLVSVDIRDVNEFYPTFVGSFRQEDILETKKANVTLFSVTATDEDGGEFGDVIYAISRDRSKTFGPSCLKAYDMFHVVPDTGEVYATVDLDYEKCSQFRFDVTARDREGSSVVSIPITVSVLPVDEYKPEFQYGINDVGRFNFLVPYGSPVGYVVGQVNATDEDSGLDGAVKYSFSQATEGYSINETSGVITLTQPIVSGNARILVLTAQSTTEKVTTHITVEIIGTPPIAKEVLVLSAVFGTIIGIVVIIIIFLGVKHWRNKREFRNANKTHVKEPVTYDIPHKNGNANKGSHSLSNGNGGGEDYKLRKLNHGNKTNGIPVSNGMKMANNTTFNSQGPIYPDTTRRVPLSRQPPYNTGNDGSAEDDEVNQINSVTPSSEGQSSSTSLIPGKLARIPDPAKKQEIASGRISQDAEVTSHSSVSDAQSSCVSHVTDQKREEAYSPQTIDQLSGGGEDMAPVIDSLGDDHGEMVGTMPVFLRSLDEFEPSPSHQAPNDHLKDWTPQFQTIKSVFSDLAAMKQVAQQNYPKALTSSISGSRASNSSSILSEPPGARPPPLLTTVPQQNGHLAAPIPISSPGAEKSSLDFGYIPRNGLYLRPNPIYQSNTPPLRNHPSGIPPPYSYVMSRHGSDSGPKHNTSLSWTPENPQKGVYSPPNHSRGVVHTRSDDSNLKSRSPERMVHV